MADRGAKDALYEGFAEVARALASGRRAEMADLLAQGERPVEQIAGEIGQSVANTSHHLRAMARAGLVTTRRDGTRIFYTLASDRVAALWSALQDVAAEHVAGLERLAEAYLGSRDGIEVVGREELAAHRAPGPHRGPHRRGTLGAGHPAAPPAARAAPWRRRGGVLPRPVLRVRRRGSPGVDPPRVPGLAAGRRVSRMEAGRAAGGSRDRRMRARGDLR